MKTIKFEKWQGLGNDFVILNDEKATPELARIMCNRNFGVGADGLFSPVKTQDTDIGWDFYNSDGSIAQMCGNGIRCFAKFAKENKLVDKNEFSVKTLAGTIVPKILPDGRVRVDMGKPILEAQKIPVNIETPQDFEIEGFSASAISMGNPHCVIFTDGDSKKLAREFGPKIEPHKLFPQKTNVEFVKIENRSKIHLDVYERGCGITFVKIENRSKIHLDVYERGCGITLACGTGACAATVAGVLKGLLDNTVTVELPGGELTIEYNGENVYMTGCATKVFEGEFFCKK